MCRAAPRLEYFSTRLDRIAGTLRFVRRSDGRMRGRDLSRRAPGYAGCKQRGLCRSKKGIPRSPFLASCAAFGDLNAPRTADVRFDVFGPKGVRQLNHTT